MATKNRTLQLLMGLWLCGVAIYPAGDNVNFRHITMDDGLSQNSVYAIIQDRMGFLWFGTEDGLNRYDGYTFKIFTPRRSNPGSLSGNYINALLQDKNGNLWVGTDNGLNRIDARTEKITRYMAMANDPTSLSGKNVKALVKDRQGFLWVGTYGSGLCRFDPNRQKFFAYRHDSHNGASLGSDVILALHLDRNGALWIGTSSGLDRLEPGKNNFTHYSHDANDPFSLSSDMVNAILQDREGFIWIGTASGLNRFDRQSGKFSVFTHDTDNRSTISHNAVNTLFQDSQGTLWIGTDFGLNSYDRQNNLFRRYPHDPEDPSSLGGDSVRSIFEDSTGTLWVGIWGAGISKYERENKKFRHVKRNANSSNSLSNNMVLSFYEEPGDILWIGSFGGLNRWDRRANRFTLFQNDPHDSSSLSDNRVRAIFRDSEGLFWIGTYGGGFNRFDSKTGKFIRFQNDPRNARSLSHNQVRSICEDKQGNLWIGTDGGGANRFDKKSGSCKRYLFDPGDPGSLSHNRVFKIFVDRGGRLWIATLGGGINRYIPETDTFFHYRNDPVDPLSLPSDNIFTIFEDSHGTLWLGSSGAGLIRLDPQNVAFTVFAEEQGLPNNTVYAILEDEAGNLWLSHATGISRFNPRSSAFKNYTIQDGLQGNDFNGNSGFKSPHSGEMFFGGINGFNSFFPAEIKDNSIVPAVVITGFQLFNKPIMPGTSMDGRTILRESIEVTRQIELNYRDKVITFEFAALNYISSGKNQYAYMMEGFDNDWNYVGTRRNAYFTGLPPGNYTFRVKGSNNDGIWNESGTSLALRITPPFWKSWWFIALSALFVFATAYSLYRRRVRHLELSKLELERQVSLRTQELKEISLKDPLTGLRNRRYLHEVLREDINSFIKKKIYLLKKGNNRRKETEDLVYGILMADIDFFKTLNDQYGHEMGDRFLVQFSAIQKKNIRSDDEAIRFGGEEFLIILKNTKPDYIDTLARKIREDINHIEMAIENDALRRSCSIGYTQFPFYEDDPSRISFEKSIQLADLALYFAKRNGRNMCVKIAAGKNRATEEQINVMTSSLDYGIEQGLFEIKPFA